MDTPPIYSEDIKDIIGASPRWMLRTGSSLLLVLVIGCLGLSAVISIPQQSSSRVFISGINQPYYLIQDGHQNPLALASGQIVSNGQHIAKIILLDKTEYIKAPFKSIFFAKKTNNANSIIGDTIGILVPLLNTYNFTGKISLKQFSKLKQEKNLTITIPHSNNNNSQIRLIGMLSYINPSIHNGLITYTGQLATNSNKEILEKFPSITNLEGTLLLNENKETILQQILN